MKTVALITEYNPLHNGHVHHLLESKKITDSENVIVLMSGDFVQRGTTSIMNKYDKTLCALKSGADVVLEMSSVISTSSAEYFAKGSIKTLTQTNIVDSICFGSELGDIKKLDDISNFLISPPIEFNNVIKELVKSGLSYSKAYNTSLNSYFNNFSSLDSPNNSLAVQYINAVKQLESNIKYYTIKRVGNSYHDNLLNNNSNFSSATSIRNLIAKDNINLISTSVPKITLDLLKKYDSFTNYNSLSNLFHHNINTMTNDQLLNIVDINQELLNRIVNISKRYYMLDDVIDNVKSKNYTRARIQRVVTNIILDNKKSDLNYLLSDKIPYIRVLGFNKSKDYLISELIKKSNVPVITNVKNVDRILDDKAMYFLNKDITASKTYGYSINKIHDEFKNSLVII